MSENLPICRACLATKVNLYNIHDKGLTETFLTLMGISVLTEDKMPPYICDVCLYQIRKFEVYRDRCHSSFGILQSLIRNDVLTADVVHNMDLSEHFYLKQSIVEIISIVPDKPECTFSDLISIDVVEDKTYIFKRNNIGNTFITSPDVNNKNLVIENQNVSVPTVQHVETIDLTDDQDTSVDVENTTYGDVENMTSGDVEKMTSGDVENNNCNDNEEQEIECEEIYFDEDIMIKNEHEIIIHEDPLTEKTMRKRKMEIGESNNSNDEITVTEGKLAEIKLVRGDNNTVNMEKIDVEEALEEFETIKKRKEEDRNAKIYYENFSVKTLTRVQVKKRMQAFEDFSNKYDVDITFLTKEEQRRQLEESKKQFQHFPFQCDICYLGFTSEDAYNYHMFVHGPAAGDFECEICHLREQTSYRLNIHIKNTHCIMFTCRICGKITKNCDVAKQHHGLHSEYNCRECQSAFQTSSNYLDHQRYVHNMIAYIPLECQQPLGEGDETHVNNTQVRCNSCDLYFETKTALIKHLKNSTDGDCTAGVS